MIRRHLEPDAGRLSCRLCVNGDPSARTVGVCTTPSKTAQLCRRADKALAHTERCLNVHLLDAVVSLGPFEQPVDASKCESEPNVVDFVNLSGSVLSNLRRR